MDICVARLQEYLDGEIERIDELEENSLVKFKGFEEEAVIQNEWNSYISTSVVVG